MTKLLILIGHSGSGKTWLSNKLEKEHGWFRMTQVTTRDRRIDEPEDAYSFINEKEYDDIKDSLFGKTDVNGCKYGTCRTLYHNKFNVVVLNKKGLEDFLDKTKDDRTNLDLCILGLEIDGKGREGRNIDLEKEETKVVCDFLLKSDDYFSEAEVLAFLKEKKGW